MQKDEVRKDIKRNIQVSSAYKHFPWLTHS